MSAKQLYENHSYQLPIDIDPVSGELIRLSRKVNQIEDIFNFCVQNKREVFSVRSRLIKAIAERRMTLNFLKETNRKKYVRVLKTLNQMEEFQRP